MGVDYCFEIDLNKLYNASIDDDIFNPRHDEMLEAYSRLLAFILEGINWRDTALEISGFHGAAERDAMQLAAELEEVLKKTRPVYWEHPGEASPALIAHYNRLEQKK
jgi:hypothetical protein